jgi:hypothetical protein
MMILWNNISSASLYLDNVWFGISEGLGRVWLVRSVVRSWHLVCFFRGGSWLPLHTTISTSSFGLVSLHFLEVSSSWCSFKRYYTRSRCQQQVAISLFRALFVRVFAGISFLAVFTVWIFKFQQWMFEGGRWPIWSLIYFYFVQIVLCLLSISHINLCFFETYLFIKKVVVAIVCIMQYQMFTFVVK